MFGLQINVQVLGEIRLTILVPFIGLISYAHQIVRLYCLNRKLVTIKGQKGHGWDYYSTLKILGLEEWNFDRDGFPKGTDDRYAFEVSFTLISIRFGEQNKLCYII